MRPSREVPLSEEMAFSASSVVAISTKPKPRERPVSRSVITAADITSPKRAKAPRRPSLEVENERPPTNSFTDMTLLLSSAGSIPPEYISPVCLLQRAMPPRNDDLHGNAPDDSRVALVLVDVINDLEFEGADRLLPQALAMADRLAALAARARRARVPVVYVNDNFGRWRSDFRTLLDRCLRGPVRGRSLARRLRPRATDYVVLKTKHS